MAKVETIEQSGFNASKYTLQRTCEDITCIPVWDALSELVSRYP